MIIYIIWLCTLIEYNDGRMQIYNYQFETAKECHEKVQNFIYDTPPIIGSEISREGKCFPVRPHIYYESREK